MAQRPSKIPKALPVAAPLDAEGVSMKDALTGYSPFSRFGGVSRGAPWQIVLTASTTCFGSSGQKEDKEEKALSEALKPKELLKLLESDKEVDHRRAVSLLSDHTKAKFFIEDGERLILSAAQAIGTHTDKVSLPTSPYGVLVAEPDVMNSNMPLHGVCSGTFLSRSVQAASGNAALSAAMRFLTWNMEIDGKAVSLLESVPLWDGETHSMLGNMSAGILGKAFDLYKQSVKAASKLTPRKGHRILLWPSDECKGADSDYTAVTPVSSFSMLGELEVRLRQRTRGENRMLINTRAIALGGSKPQNVGLLALDASGSFLRLLSMPMPPPSKSLAWLIKKDVIRFSSGLISRDALEGFQSAAEHEMSHPIAENRLRTDRMFAHLVSKVVEPFANLAKVAKDGTELGPNITVALKACAEGDDQFEEICQKVQKAVFQRLGSLKLGPEKKEFLANDQQRARFVPIVSQRIREEIL